MVEIYPINKDAVSGLLELYSEAKEAHAEALCDEIWAQLTTLDQERTKERLKGLRTRLDNLLKPDETREREL
jgi:putative heme iron utilization protein